MKHKIASGVLALGFLLGASPAAHAAGSESGYIYDTDCPQPSDPWVVGRTTGSTDILGPGKSSYVNYFNGSTMQDRYVAGTLTGGYWHVTTSGTLNNPGTYGYCRNV